MLSAKEVCERLEQELKNSLIQDIINSGGNLTLQNYYEFEHKNKTYQTLPAGFKHYTDRINQYAKYSVLLEELGYKVKITSFGADCFDLHFRAFFSNVLIPTRHEQLLKLEVSACCGESND